MKKIIISLLILASTLATVGLISYKYAESIISYDFEKSVIKRNTYTEVSNKKYNHSIDEIPYSESYTVKMIDDKIVVYDNQSNTIYQAVVDISAFTTSDLKQLEQDGIKFTAHSDLVEILNYICS